MKPRRLLLAFSAVVALAAVSAVTFRLKLSSEVEATTRARQAELAAFRAKIYPREVHAPPTLPGSFAELSRPPFDWIAQHAKEIAEASKDCGDVTHPAKRLPAEVGRLEQPIPPGCNDFTRAGWMGVIGLLRASHAQSGATPTELDLGPDHPAAPWMLDVAWMAVIRAIQLSALGKPDVSLDICGDLLALARDLANGSGALGLGIESTYVDIATPPCEKALGAATPAARAAFRDALDHILRSLPPLSDTFREEAVAEWLYIDSSAATRSMLAAAAFEDESLRRDRTFQALAAAADLPAADRASAFRAIQADESRGWNPLARIASPDWERWAERDDEARARLQMLWEKAAGATSSPLPAQTPQSPAPSPSPSSTP